MTTMASVTITFLAQEIRETKQHNQNNHSSNFSSTSSIKAGFTVPGYRFDHSIPHNFFRGRGIIFVVRNDLRIVRDGISVRRFNQFFVWHTSRR